MIGIYAYDFSYKTLSSNLTTMFELSLYHAVEKRL